MNKNYKIEYLPSAVKDLTSIIEYISLDSPKNALKLLDKIDNTIAILKTFPFSSVVPKDIRLERLGYRILIVDNYLVFYVILENTLEIRRVISSRKKYDFLF